MSISGSGGPGGIGGSKQWGDPHVKQHTVRQGETLASIGQQHGLERKALADANPQLGGAEPKAGMTLQIPQQRAEGGPHVKGGPQVHADTFEKASQNLLDKLTGEQAPPRDPVEGGDGRGTVLINSGAWVGPPAGMDPTNAADSPGTGDESSLELQPGEDRAINYQPGDNRSIKAQPGEDLSRRLGPETLSIIGEDGVQTDLDADIAGGPEKGE